MGLTSISNSEQVTVVVVVMLLITSGGFGFVLFCFSLVLGILPRASHTVGKRCSPEQQLRPSNADFESPFFLLAVNVKISVFRYFKSSYLKIVNNISSCIIINKIFLRP